MKVAGNCIRRKKKGRYNFSVGNSLGRERHIFRLGRRAGEKGGKRRQR